MTTEIFTGDPSIQQLVNFLGSEIKDKQFSDVIDEKGNQYVDLVQEGGGVLGIALLGYTYILEQAGIRFFSLAGTSAGAINALLLAACGSIASPKTLKILEFMLAEDLSSFVDGPLPVKKFFNAVKKDSFIGVELFWGSLCLPYLFKNKGLNPGDAFKNWIIAVLQSVGISSTKDLETIRDTTTGIRIRSGINRSTIDLKPKLKIITAEITTESRVIFPEMNFLFWNDVAQINPAEYLRASMSIPVFFHPYKVNRKNMVINDDWKNCVKFNGIPPLEAIFVDGGILSNFPIDVFHNYNVVPRLPTFGVKLGDDRNQLNKAGSIPELLMAMFNSSRHVLDYQFLLQNEDYEQLITRIKVGDHNWLNFSLSDDDKLDLFKRGALAAADFLIKFDWGKYKLLRESLIH